MRGYFSLAMAARLADLSLEATSEAARILQLKARVKYDVEGQPLGPWITFKGISILRGIAPDLRRGVTADVAYARACALACEQIAEGGACLVTQLRPAIPNTAEALRHIDAANEVFFKAFSLRYERELNLATAERLLRRSIALDPNIAVAWGDLAAVLWEQSAKRATCAELYRRALELDPDMVDALHVLGAMALQEGRPDEAEPLLRRASRLAPREGRFFELLATVYTALGDLGKAQEAAEQAQAIEDDHRPLVAPG